MGHSMTVLTSRSYTMFGFVTIDTFEFGMFCLSRFKFFLQVSMARTAVFVGYVFSIGDIERLMNLVTGNTVLELLSFSVGLMTLETIRDVTVLCMAICTVDLTVGTGIVFDFFYLFRMAGIAGIHVVFATEDDIQRLVGVFMTPEAALEFEMGLSLVAFGTLRDYLFSWYKGWMSSLMTVKTANLCLVLSSSLLIFMYYFRMAFDTVTVLQLGF